MKRRHDERMARILAVPIALVTIAGCAHDSSGGGGPPSMKPTANPSAFFAGRVETYGQYLTPREINERAVARAVQRIDPCGFVDSTTAEKTIPGVMGYGYGSGLGACTVLQEPGGERPASNVTIYLNYTAETAAAHDESEHNDTFNVDGITVTESAVGALCVETFSLGLASLPGAPKDPEMIAHFDAAFPLVVSSKRAGDPSCGQAKAMALAAAKIRAANLPLRDTHSPIPVPLLAEDPCAVFPELTGFTKAFDVVPDRCMFTGGGNSPVGLQFSSIEAHYVRHAPTSSIESHEGVLLYTGLEHPGCSPVYVVTGPPLEPVPIGPHAAGFEDAPLPDIAVRGGNCEQNKQIALVAARKFTH